MKSFYVIVYNFNEDTFEPYDVMPYLIAEYKKVKVKPSTIEEFKSFVRQKARHQWWCRCEYEIILSHRPGPWKEHSEKWDVYCQLMMNIDTVVEILMQNLNDC